MYGETTKTTLLLAVGLVLLVTIPAAAKSVEGQEKVVLVNDGRVVQGTLVSETNEAITIRTAAGQQVRIARADIEKIVDAPQRRSPSPSPSDSLTAPASTYQVVGPRRARRCCLARRWFRRRR